jgi:hypothetical protein
MQRPSAGYRGGIRAGHHYTYNDDIENGNDDDDNSSLSNSDERKDYSSLEINNDFESAIRNLRPSAVQLKKIKTNLNISKQKADLPQLNTTNGDNQNNEQKHEENNHQDKQSRRWFPKADVGHVDSDDFIRHNHVGKLI